MNIRKTFVAVVAMAAVFLASGCKSGREYAGGETAGITGVSDTMTVDRVLVSADSLSGHEVVFEGVCTHICAHGGRKIFVMGSDDSKVLRVEADGFIGSFPEETVNSIVVVKGILAEDRIDEAYLDAWEQKIKETEAVNTASESSHCDAEQKAQGQADIKNAFDRIGDFRSKIASRTEKEGKPYLSFYHVDASQYEIK
ncbi:MAG: hypothetical protein DBY00_02230 [Flavobacteriales bacterium]|nr:MAG: hypothetical protein DBY00_02230 [Flavobacteriales bacterium]